MLARYDTAIVKILLIEDEPGIAALVRRGLEHAGYAVDASIDGADGLEQALSQNFDLILLDVMLPKMDGWQVCEALRAQGRRTPILMLTARDGVDDRIKGLDIGADDYLPKPFHFGELLARVRALTRRDRVHRTRIIRVADLEIDIARRRVCRAGAEIGLSHREYTLLEALAGNAGRVLTRELIQERIWRDDDSYSNTVDVYIRMLRKKIDAEHAVKLIHTVRGSGYTLSVPESEGGA